MKLGIKRLLTGATITALTVGSLLIAPAAQASTPDLGATRLVFGAQNAKASHGTATKIEVRWHTDKLYLYPASKTPVLPYYGQPSGLYSKYTILEKHGSKTIYKKTVSVYKALYFAGHFDINRHYKDDKTLVKVTKHYANVSTAKAKKYVKNTLGLPQDPVEVREYLVQNDVLYTAYDVETALTDNPDVDVTTLAPEKTAGYNGSVVITAIPAVPATDTTAAVAAGYQVTGTDTDDNYTYTYNSITGEFTAGTITQ